MNIDRKKPFKLPDLSKTRALYEDHLPFIEATLHSLYLEVSQLLELHGFTPTINYRVKRFDPYFEKLRKQNLRGDGKNSHQIDDFLGIRIICPFLEDIDSIERLLSTSFEVLETERKSAQHSFREFGYDSVHLSIQANRKMFNAPIPGVRNVCEIQLRTILQEAWAEVEHELIYKSDISMPKELARRKLAALNASLALSDLIFQEIRDCQKEIRQHDRKKQEILDKTVDEHSRIDISADQLDQTNTLPSMHRSRLEKTMFRALEAHSNHDLDTAIELYGVILGMKLDGSVRSLVYNHRGMAYFSLSNYLQAVKDFTRAIHFNPTSDRSYANRGLCFRVMQRFDQALADYTEALKIDPNRPDACFGLAQTHFDMSEPGKSLIVCKKVLEISPGYKSARELIAQISRDKLIQ